MTGAPHDPGLAPGAGMFVFDGDSISSGEGAPPGEGLEQQVLAGLGWTGAAVNVARPGRPMAACLTLFHELVAPHRHAGTAPFLLFVHAGDNDVVNTITGAYASLSSYVGLAHAQGWRVIASTELARPDFPPGYQAELDDYNRLVLDNAAGADVVLDFAAVPGMGAADRAGSPLFAPDRIHPSVAGYALLAAMTVHAVRPLLASP